MKTFYAQEPHVDGTTIYRPGDKREADENEVKHLVDLKVLGDKPPQAGSTGEKGDINPANKAEGIAENKAAPAPANKAAK